MNLTRRRLSPAGLACAAAPLAVWVAVTVMVGDEDGDQADADGTVSTKETANV